MDRLLKCLIFDGELSLSVIKNTDMINEAIRIHSLSPSCAAALGRTLTVCTFMSSGLKSDKDKLRFWLEHSNAKEEQESLSNQEDEKFKEDLDFSLRNLILTESIIKRKGRK